MDPILLTEAGDVFVGGNDGEEILGLAGDDDLSGGPGDDTLHGGPGDDRFDWDPLARGGADSFYGGPGDDVFVLADPGDQAIELPGEGIDLVWAAFSHSLQATPDIENLGLLGDADIDAAGNAGGNWLMGNDADNLLDGAGGDDLLDGGAGEDTLLGAAGADALYGEAGNDLLDGGEGHDTLCGGAGDDTLEGGTGIDVAVYAAERAQYQTSEDQGVRLVTALASDEGTDFLTGIERLWFVDRKLAVDFGAGGHAEITARILGAVFGPAAIANAEYAGIGLDLLDNAGFDYESLMQLALEVQLGPGFSTQAMVALILGNLGVPNDAATVDYYSGFAGTPAFPTQVALAIYGADHEINASRIDLAGLVQNGLEYLLV